MFVMDVPDVPPQYAPVVIAQTTQARRTQAETDGTIGVCQLVSNPIRKLESGAYSAVNSVGPLGATGVYLYRQEGKKIGEMGTVTILNEPAHGILEPIEGARGTGFYFIPEPDYIGSDRATFLVEAGGKKYRVEYFIQVQTGIGVGDYENPQLCPNGEYWKISLNPDDPNAPIYTFESRRSD